MRLTCGRAPKALASLIVVCLAAVCASAQGKLGRFTSEPLVKFLPDGRNVELATPLTYIDSHDITWTVPAGTHVDGASIPQVFWSFMGAPFTGKFRDASIIHDYFCVKKNRHWRAVHKVFLDGMLARDVGTTLAKLMYTAVYRFGPRWDFDIDACYCEGCPTCSSPVRQRVKYFQPRYNAGQFEELRKKLDEGQSIEALEDLADYQLNTEFLNKK